MSLELIPCRGVVFKVSPSGEGGEGFALNPPLNGSEESPILMQSLNVQDRVVNMPVLTLNGVRILYVFGKDWGDISVGGVALLGKGGTGGALKAVASWYSENNVANNKEVSVSLPGEESYRFYVIGLSIGDPNTEFQYFPFQIIGKIIEL